MSGAGALGAKASAWAAAARANPLFRAGLAGAAAIVILDQATKYWILNVVRLPARPGGTIDLSAVFDLTYVENYGASFGLLAGGLVSRLLLSAISIAVAAALTVWLGRLARRWAAAGAALIVGGAVGNLIDRVRLGYVVDFLDFSGAYFPWVFNVADMAINVGVACLLVDAFLNRERDASKTPPSGS